MAGIFVEINGVENNVVCTKVEQFELDVPVKTINLYFGTFINGERVNPNYMVILSGDERTDFYERWNNHREVYVEVCKQQGWDESIVPEDMDSEVE